MAILLNDNLDVAANKPTDTRYGPYASVQAANDAIPAFKRYIGLTVGIGTSDVVDYWYKAGTTNTDLVEKTSGASGGVTSVNGEIGVVVIDKTDVGLANVDNTSDADKPVSTAQQTALNAKENTITAGTTGQYWRGDKSWQTLNKTAVGLSNVDNTSDASKPVSTAQQTALNAKQDTLVSGTNIKTINGTSILGAGDVVIGSGGTTQVNSDWTATTGVAQILNKPTEFPPSAHTHPQDQISSDYYGNGNLYEDIEYIDGVLSGLQTSVNNNQLTTPAILSTNATLTAGRWVHQRVQNLSASSITITLPTSPTAGDRFIISSTGGATQVAQPIIIRRRNWTTTGTGDQFTTLATITALNQEYQFTTQASAQQGWYLEIVETHGHKSGEITTANGLNTFSSIDDIVVNYANGESLQPVAWSGLYEDLGNIPSTFTPSSHTHALTDLQQGGATLGQVIKWNGTNWAPGTDDSSTGGSGNTNLSYTASPTGGTVVSDTGNDATLPLATTTNAGLMAPIDKTKLTQLSLEIETMTVSNTAQITLQSNKHYILNKAVNEDINLGLPNPAVNGDSISIAITYFNNATGNFIVGSTGGTPPFQPLATLTSENDYIKLIYFNGWRIEYFAKARVNLTDITQGGANTGQVIKWDGTKWAPGADGGSVTNVNKLSTGEWPHTLIREAEGNTFIFEAYVEQDGRVTYNCSNNTVSSDGPVTYYYDTAASLWTAKSTVAPAGFGILATKTGAHPLDGGVWFQGGDNIGYFTRGLTVRTGEFKSIIATGTPAESTPYGEKTPGIILGNKLTLTSYTAIGPVDGPPGEIELVSNGNKKVILTTDSYNPDGPADSTYLFKQNGGGQVARIADIFLRAELPEPNISVRVAGAGEAPYSLDLSTFAEGDLLPLKRVPEIVVRDISEERIADQDLFLECVIINKRKVSTTGKHRTTFAVPSPWHIEQDPQSGEIVQDWIHPWPQNFMSRAGVHDVATPDGPTLIKMGRPNHFVVTALGQRISLIPFLNGRFAMRPVKYRPPGADPGEYETIELFTPLNMGRRTTMGTRMPYAANFAPLRIACRYVIWDSAANDGRGQFIVGPLSKTIKIWYSPFPFNLSHIDSSDSGNPVATINEKHLSSPAMDIWLE